MSPPVDGGDEVELKKKERRTRLENDLLEENRMTNLKKKGLW